MKWDAIIIGTGLSAMTTGLELAKAGKKILILEQHSIPGGYATAFKRKGFTFDVSLHQMPGLEKGNILFSVLQRLGVMQHINPIPLNEVQTVDTEMGQIRIGPNYLEQLMKLFPGEVKTLKRIRKTMKKIARELFIALVLSKNNIYSKFLNILAPTISKICSITLKEYLDDIIDSETLKKLLSIQTGYFSTPAEEISAFFYLLAFSQFLFDGIYYLKGTSQTLSNGFIQEIEKNGGQVLLNQKVDKILIIKNEVQGVQTEDKKDKSHHTYYSSIIVSGADPFQIFNKLASDYSFPNYYLEKAKQLTPGHSSTCFYVGLDCSLQELTGQANHSLVYLDNKGIKDGKDFTIEGWTDYSCIDPDLAPPGKTTLCAIGSDRYEDWQNLSSHEYKKKKEYYRDYFLNFMEEKIPGFRDKVEYMEIGTPKTMERYTYNRKGAFNGFAYTVDRVKNLSGGLDAKTPLKGLYLSSAWAGPFSGGFSGSILCGSMIGKKILKEIKNV